MKAVILPTGNPDLLRPINNWIPEFLIPVVNKPVIEHLLELLLINNVRDIILVLKHMPYETEKYFGKGERWGCNISYSLERTYEGILPAIKRIQPRLNDSFICLPENIITNIDISSFVRTHEKSGADITFPILEKWLHSSDSMESYPFIINPRTLSRFINSFPTTWNLKQIIDNLSNQCGLNVQTYKAPFDYYTIRDLNDYVNINRIVLNGQLRGINIPGRQIKKGVWVGRHTQIHPGVELHPPLVIGNSCNIRNLVSIGEDTVIGDNVIVDSGADIKKSIIYNDTYIGAHTEINDSIIRKKFMFNLPRMLNIYVSDDFILGNLDRNTVIKKIGRFINSAAALALFLIFSPLMLQCLLLHMMFPSKRFLFKEERYGTYKPDDITGESKPELINMFLFRSKIGLINKLPGLINVIKGDINLIGNSALTRDEVASLSEDWEKIRFNGPSGLFHSWEVEQAGDISWEEKIVTENYYACTRSFWGDVGIFLKYFLPKRKGVYRHSPIDENRIDNSKVIERDFIKVRQSGKTGILSEENNPLESQTSSQ
jgi:NDP-sugar pyrophosphorylase family protein